MQGQSTPHPSRYHGRPRLHEGGLSAFGKLSLSFPSPDHHSSTLVVEKEPGPRAQERDFSIQCMSPYQAASRRLFPYPPLHTKSDTS